VTGRQRVPQRRTLTEPRTLSCGCTVPAGGEAVRRAQGRPWTCLSHYDGLVRAGGQAPRRGAASVPEVLADEARRR
jgi:hypothetical protein